MRRQAPISIFINNNKAIAVRPSKLFRSLFKRRGVDRRPLGGERHRPHGSHELSEVLQAVNGALIARRETGVSRRPMRAPPPAVEDH